jgi:hypothetical protein
MLHLGDMIIVAYADRYATDQYESYVPTTLGRTHLVASGGIASQVESRSTAVSSATEIVPLGLIGDRYGLPINVKDFALPRIDPASVTRPRTIAVFGTAMNAGKTSTIHQMLYGLSKAGACTGAAKLTGTGSGNDFWLMLDAGAHCMFDFTDAGLASTFKHSIERLEDAAEQLVAHIGAKNCDVAFVEIADGLYQQENQLIVRSPRYHALIDTVIFAASDAMGAVNGVENLRKNGFHVAAISGTLTRSSLAIRETEEALDLPVLRLADLEDPRIIAPILGIDTSSLIMPNDEPDLWQTIVPGLIGASGHVHSDEEEEAALHKDLPTIVLAKKSDANMAEEQRPSGNSGFLFRDEEEEAALHKDLPAIVLAKKSDANMAEERNPSGDSGFLFRDEEEEAALHKDLPATVLAKKPHANMAKERNPSGDSSFLFRSA